MYMAISVVVESHSERSAVENAQSWFNEHLHYEDGLCVVPLDVHY